MKKKPGQLLQLARNALEIPLVVPCHRAVGSNGIGGFGHHGEGFHIEIKRWLLEHECDPARHEKAN